MIAGFTDAVLKVKPLEKVELREGFENLRVLLDPYGSPAEALRKAKAKETDSQSRPLFRPLSQGAVGMAILGRVSKVLDQRLKGDKYKRDLSRVVTLIRSMGNIDLAVELSKGGLRKSSLLDKYKASKGNMLSILKNASGRFKDVCVCVLCTAPHRPTHTPQHTHPFKDDNTADVDLCYAGCHKVVCAIQKVQAQELVSGFAAAVQDTMECLTRRGPVLSEKFDATVSAWKDNSSFASAATIGLSFLADTDIAEKHDKVIQQRTMCAQQIKGGLGGVCQQLTAGGHRDLTTPAVLGFGFRGLPLADEDGIRHRPGP